MKIKYGHTIAMIAVFVILTGALINHCVNPDVIRTVTPDTQTRYTNTPWDIITSDGECWVVEREPDNKYVKEALFHANNLDDCINFIRESDR